MSNSPINFSEEAMLHQDLVVFAARHSISPAVAVVLPALFERVAPEAGMSVRGLVAEATYHNHKLGEYLAECARKAHSDFCQEQYALGERQYHTGEWVA